MSWRLPTEGASRMANSSRTYLSCLNVFSSVLMLSLVISCLFRCSPCDARDRSTFYSDCVQELFAWNGIASRLNASSPFESWGISTCCTLLKNVCSEEDGCQRPTSDVSSRFVQVEEGSLRSSPGKMEFKMSNGRVVSCFFLDSLGSINAGHCLKNMASVASPVSEVGVQEASEQTVNEHGVLKEMKSCLSTDTSIPELCVNPAMLDWGTNILTFVALANTCSNRVLPLFETCSADLQLNLEAFHGSYSLILLEGSEPFFKLEFNCKAKTIDMSSIDPLPDTGKLGAFYSHHLLRELHIKNACELHIQVTKMQVLGTRCHLDGFVIHTRYRFNLAPGESTRLLISYQPDFSTALVSFELGMPAGFFVIPMEATLPLYMINQSRKTFFHTVPWRVYILAFASVFTVVFVICILPFSISPGTEHHFVEGKHAIKASSSAGDSSYLQHSSRGSRLTGEDKLVVDFGNGFPPRGPAGGIKRMQGKQDLDHQKETMVTAPAATSKPARFPDNLDASETQQDPSLTVRSGREKGRRRRKRRTIGSELLAKLEASSSQSSDSTPSSPSSPNTCIAKQAWPLFLDTPHNQPFRVSEDRNQQRKLEPLHSTEAKLSEVVKHCDETWSPSTYNHFPAESDSRPNLPPSAAFPSTGYHVPGMATPSFLAITSPIIPPHARAPGSELNKGKAVKREEGDAFRKELVYDIWGNHFEHLLGGPKNLTAKVYDASEGDSMSFYVRGPDSLMMMMASASAVSCM